MASVAERFHLRSAAAFAVGLHPPLSPSVCPSCVALFIKKVETDTPLMKLVQTKCHAFLDAMMAFVASDWTPEHQATASGLLLRSHLQCTRCKPAGHAVAVAGLPDAETWFGVAFQVACSCIRICSIQQLARGKGFVSKRGLWPTSAEQLFPYGPERTLESLIARLDQYSFAEAVIVNIVTLHRPIAFRVILKDENRFCIIWTAIARFAACSGLITSELARLSEPVDPSARRAAAKKHIIPCEGTALMLHALAFGPDHTIDDHHALFRWHEPELFQALHPLVLLLYDDEDYDWMAFLASHLWLSLSELQRDACGCPNPPVYSQGIVEHSGDVGEDPYRALHFFLSRRPTLRHCNGPDCRRTVHENGLGVKFSRCGRCRIMQYCSKDCQKADWSQGAFPHKGVCDMFQELYTSASLRMTVDEFVTACRVHNYPLDRVDHLIAWATNGETTSRYAAGAILVADLRQR